MTCTLTYQKPNADFWAEYAQLWRESSHPSPFQAPAILRYYAERQTGGVALFTAHHNGHLVGATLLRRSGDHWVFLSDLKTDANFFILHRDLDTQQQRAYFDQLFRAAQRENWGLMLNHKPTWARYMPAFEQALKNSGLYTLSLDYSVCPIAEASTPQALFDEVRTSQNTRRKLNKFVKQEQGTFEVLTDDSDLDGWAEDFCNAHVLRWAPTPTPSAYRDPARREFLKNCLRAWQQDGLLVRFALRTPNGGRIGLMAGLLEGETLIYHTPTFHPEYAHVSPGRVLIYYIAQWMAENGLRRLDFGDGNEPYKYYVASKDQVLRRVFVARKNNLRFILKTRFIQAVRENPRLYGFYQNRLKPLYRNLRRNIAVLCLVAVVGVVVVVVVVVVGRDVACNVSTRLPDYPITQFTTPIIPAIHRQSSLLLASAPTTPMPSVCYTPPCFRKRLSANFFTRSKFFAL